MSHASRPEQTEGALNPTCPNLWITTERLAPPVKGLWGAAVHYLSEVQWRDRRFATPAVPEGRPRKIASLAESAIDASPDCTSHSRAWALGKRDPDLQMGAMGK